MTEQHIIPDEQMELLDAAFDAAWMGSLAWNRGMSGLPIWNTFLEKHGLTECYKDWFQRNRSGDKKAGPLKTRDPILEIDDTI